MWPVGILQTSHRGAEENHEDLSEERNFKCVPPRNEAGMKVVSLCNLLITFIDTKI
jgi:hypothetical protein